MNLYEAELSEITLALRRDDEHIQALTEKLSTCFKSLFGDLQWIRCYKYFPYFCRFFYYATTNLCNLQSLGEEYVQLIQVADQKRRKAASLYRRLLFVLFEVFGELLAKKVHERINEIALKKFQVSRISLFWTKVILSFLEPENMTNLHKGIFFAFHSKYYSFSRRFTGISYLSLRPQSNSQISKIFTFIGFSIIVQCFVSFSLRTLKEWKKLKSLSHTSKTNSVDVRQLDEKMDEESNHICFICSTNKLPVCTPCGHIFCWECVMDYSAAEEMSAGAGRCPNCRREFLLNRIVPLLNY